MRGAHRSDKVQPKVRRGNELGDHRVLKTIAPDGFHRRWKRGEALRGAEGDSGQDQAELRAIRRHGSFSKPGAEGSTQSRRKAAWCERVVLCLDETGTHFALDAMG